MTVPEEYKVEKDLMVKTIPEGLFVVNRCKGVNNLGPTWKELSLWIKKQRKIYLWRTTRSRTTH